MLTFWLRSTIKSQKTPGWANHVTSSYLLSKVSPGMKCGTNVIAFLPVMKLFLGLGEVTPLGLQDENLS